MYLRLTKHLLPLVLAGCATATPANPTVAENRLAHLPLEQQTALAASQRVIEEKTVDVSLAGEARDLAGTFLTVTQEQAEAAQSALRARPADPAASTQARAADAKRVYAQRLLLQREAELTVKRHELALARDQYERTKARMVGEPLAPFDAAVDKQQTALARARQKVASLGTEVVRLRLAWDTDRRSADYASARSLENPTRRPLTPEMPPAQGVNEGPSAGFHDLPDTDQKFSR
jgi:hypothetical protein